MILRYLLLAFLLFPSAAILAQSSASESRGIRGNFSDESILVYQKSSQGKVAELYEYFTLYSDKASGPALKKQLKANITALFAADAILITNFLSANKEPVSLPAFLDIIENRSYAFVVKGVQVSADPGYDHWVNTYTVTVTEGKSAFDTAVRQKIYFSRVRKDFGQNKKSVWDIRLGETE